MIKLPVDEAYAFDYLAILTIKNDSIMQIFVREVLEEQLSYNTVNNIINSPEYNDILKANKLVFDCVERARYNPESITAKELDDANMERYYAKKALQARFFYTNLTEKKT